MTVLYFIIAAKEDLDLKFKTQVLQNGKIVLICEDFKGCERIKWNVKAAVMSKQNNRDSSALLTSNSWVPTEMPDKRASSDEVTTNSVLSER